jgi:uncharacterized protein YigE (DUF2233 family)
VLALNPISASLPSVAFIDVACERFETYGKKYKVFIQNIRMIDCSHNNVWENNKTISSIAALGIDSKGRLLLMMSESPCDVHDFIEIIRALPIDVSRAMYLDGGSPASLFASSHGVVVNKSGFSESGFNTNRSVSIPRSIPNVIGVVRK